MLCAREVRLIPGRNVAFADYQNECSRTSTDSRSMFSESGQNAPEYPRSGNHDRNPSEGLIAGLLQSPLPGKIL